jgi:hypothetical protein
MVDRPNTSWQKSSLQTRLLQTRLLFDYGNSSLEGLAGAHLPAST